MEAAVRMRIGKRRATLIQQYLQVNEYIKDHIFDQP